MTGFVGEAGRGFVAAVEVAAAVAVVLFDGAPEKGLGAANFESSFVT